MNEIVNKFLLIGDKFMQEMHLKQPGFTYSACGSFTKNKERIERFMQTGFKEDPNLYMASLYVDTLFANIPLDETIENF